MIHTPELSGSGQVNPCASCGLGPTIDGHDGCLGALDESIVMNACCGHGNKRYAYVQLWDSSCLRGDDAVNMINELLQKEPLTPTEFGIKNIFTMKMV